MWAPPVYVCTARGRCCCMCNALKQHSWPLQQPNHVSELRNITTGVQRGCSADARACVVMSRLVLAACVGAAAYIVLRPPRDDPLDDFEYAPPSARATPAPAPPPAAAKPPEPAPVPPQQPVQSPAAVEPVDALLLGILRFVGLQIFISVLVVLAVSLFLGAENGRTVGIGAFGIFSVFTFSALAQMRLQVNGASCLRRPWSTAWSSPPKSRAAAPARPVAGSTSSRAREPRRRHSFWHAARQSLTRSHSLRRCSAGSGCPSSSHRRSRNCHRPACPARRGRRPSPSGRA